MLYCISFLYLFSDIIVLLNSSGVGNYINIKHWYVNYVFLCEWSLSYGSLIHLDLKTNYYSHGSYTILAILVRFGIEKYYSEIFSNHNVLA